MDGSNWQLRKVQAFANAAVAAQRAGNDELEILSYRALVNTLWPAFQLHNAASLFRRATEVLVAPIENANALLGCALALSYQGRDEESLSWFERAATSFEAQSAVGAWLMALEGWLDAAVEIPDWDAVFYLCETIIHFTSSRDGPRLRHIAMKAYYQSARGFGQQGQDEAALRMAERGVDLAKELGAHDIEAHLRSLIVSLRLALDPRMRVTGSDAPFIRSLAERYAESGELAKELTYRYLLARYLERTEPIPFRECADAFQRSAELHVMFRDVSQAAECYRRAGFQLNMVTMLTPEHRERCFIINKTAAELYDSVGNQWGKGIAESHAGSVLCSGPNADPTDPRALAMLLRAVHSFRRARRIVEEAQTRVTVAMQYGRRNDIPRFLKSSLASMRAYECARTRLIQPHVREQTHEWFTHGFASLVATAVSVASTHRRDATWREIIWQLDQTIKGRSFVDQKSQYVIWKRLVESNAELRGAIRATEELGRRHAHLEATIDHAVKKHDRISLEEIIKERDRVKDALGQAEREVQTVFDAVSWENAGIPSELVSIAPVRATAIQEILQPNELFVSFIDEGFTLVRTTIHPDGARDVAVIDSAVTNSLIDWLNRSNGGIDQAFIPEWSANETKHLLGRLAPEVNTLIISPHGQLTHMPWHLLPCTLDQGELAPLGERLAIGITPTAGSFIQSRGQGVVMPATVSYIGVACNGDGNLRRVDQQVERLASSYFGTVESTISLPTCRCNELFSLHQVTRLLHFACHADKNGLLLSQNGKWTLPIDFVDLDVRADILLLTACSTGDFAKHDNNEFFGVVRQLMIVTGARAAVVSAHPVPEFAGFLFSELLLTALTCCDTGRPWESPSEPLPVGHAVEWARQQLQSMRASQVKTVVGLPVDPSHPCWWSPWYVVGDPAARMY